VSKSAIAKSVAKARYVLVSIYFALIFPLLCAVFSPTHAQQPNIYRIGVLVPGGARYEIIDGLRAGLHELGFEEGKQFTLAIKDTKGDLKLAEQAATQFEHDRVNLIFTTATSATIPARQATKDIPIVFCAGTDPVTLGLVDSFAKPGGRLTGVYYVITDLTAKRLEILKEIIPKLRRVITFYDPRSPVGTESSKLAREAARRMRIQLIERAVASSEELRSNMRALKPHEIDAFFQISDPLVSINDQFIVDTAREKGFPTMLAEESSVVRGGLVSYSISFRKVGRVSAKYVQRILTGTEPKDLPLQAIDKIDLTLNLKTAKQIGVTIPPSVLARADRVIR
jgi:putative ABC transport system substrate-binding protein